MDLLYEVVLVIKITAIAMIQNLFLLRIQKLLEDVGGNVVFMNI
jgi:hypothetical protein